LAETYFDGFEFDLGEKELGYTVSFDLDLDMFSASVALAKTCVVTILDDEGQSSFILEISRVDLHMWFPRCCVGFEWV